MGTKQGGQVMSEFERVRRLAWEEGYREGFEKGYREGIEKARLLLRPILIDVIRIRLGSSAVTPAVEQHLDDLDPDGLRETLCRAATAERIEDVFE